jgi:DNA repair protein RecO (recombination protein O)
MDGVGERNSRMQAIILKVSGTGSGNGLVTMLTREEGIRTSLLYGGPRSKMRSLIQPFNSGNVWLYEDKAKGTSKITDFEVAAARLQLKASLYKVWAATLAAEIVLKTHAAGEPEGAFVLLSAFLDGTDVSDEDGARLGTIRFLWRYLGLLGVQPSIPDCTAAFGLDAEAAAYLEALNGRSPGEVRKLVIGAAPVLQLKRMTFSLVEEAAGSRLKTLEAGFSIL